MCRNLLNKEAAAHMDTQMAWKTRTACGLPILLREMEINRLLLPNKVIANVSYA